jgi:hypothetical protein
VTGRSNPVGTDRCWSVQVRSGRDRLEQVLAGPDMSGHIRTDRFRWGHVGTGCSGRTVQVGTGLDRTGQVGTFWDMFGQVGTGRYRSGYVGAGLSVQDGHVGTGWDKLRQVFLKKTVQVGTGLYRSRLVCICRDSWGRFRQVRTFLDMLGHVGTRRDMFCTGRNRSGYVWTGRDMSGSFGTVLSVRDGKVGTGLWRSAQVDTSRDMSGHFGTSQDLT